MSKQRNHMQTLHKEVFEDAAVGAYAALGGPFYVKKILGKSKYFIQSEASLYNQIPAECFEATISRSTQFDTALIKRNLEVFNEQQGN